MAKAKHTTPGTDVGEEKKTPPAKKAAPKKSGKTPADDAPAVEVEVIEDKTEIVVFDVEKQAASEIAKIDTNKVVIEEWKQKYAPLVIVDVNDKKGYEAMLEAKRHIRTARTSVDKRRKTINEGYLAVTKKVNATSAEYTKLLEEIEAPIDEWLEKWDAWKEEEKTKKEQEAQATLNARVDALKLAGMGFNGSYYVLGDTMSMDAVTIKSMTGVEFDFFIEKVKLEKVKVDDAVEEARKKKEVEDAAAEQLRKKQEALQKENEANAKKLEEERKKLEADAAEMKRQMLMMREQMAANAGLTFNPSTTAYSFKNKYTEQSVTKKQMEELDATAFMTLMQEITGIVNIAKNNAESDSKREAQRQETLSARKVLLIGLGMQQAAVCMLYPDSEISSSTFEVIADMPEPGWQSYFTEIKAKIENLNAERVAAAEKYSKRCDAVLNLGFKKNGEAFIFANKYNESVQVGRASILACGTEDVWQERLKGWEGDVARLKQMEATKDQEAETERQNALSDVEKFNEYLTAIKAIPVPVFKTEGLTGMMEDFTYNIDKAIEDLKQYTNQ